MNWPPSKPKGNTPVNTYPVCFDSPGDLIGVLV
jgi:hypothetical protein